MQLVYNARKKRKWMRRWKRRKKKRCHCAVV